MTNPTSIEWTNDTWNPVTGCDKCSPGCQNCYAKSMAHRQRGMGRAEYARGFQVTLHPHRLDDPFKCLKSKIIFVCSMGDLFHDDVPVDFIEQVFETMEYAHWHRFQVLTKRAERLAQQAGKLHWSPNISAGVTVENSDYRGRIDLLRLVPAAVRFLSLEPLLGPLPAMDLTGIHQVIVGGESGPGARPMDPAWVRDIRNQCQRQRVPFFFKQWGGVRKKAAGRLLDGRTWDEMPAAFWNRRMRA